MPTQIFKDRTFDTRLDRLDLRDRVYQPPLRTLPDQYPGVDQADTVFACYAQNKMILDQGNQGACTGFGLAAVINYLLFKDHLQQSGIDLHNPASSDRMSSQAGLDSKKVSPRMLYNMAKIYDEWPGEEYEGSSCRGAMKGWHRHGVCRESTWPYTVDDKARPADNWAEEAAEQPLGAYYRVSKDSISDMQGAIYEVGAILCSSRIHSGWWFDVAQKSLPLIATTNVSPQGGHAFALVGYNRNGFIVQNSWGEEWGWKGFAVLPYADWLVNGMDAWVVARGAPVNRIAPTTYSSLALKSADSIQSSASQSDYPYKNPEVTPWNEETAYQHSLLIGNNGRPLHTLISEPTEQESAWRVCYHNIDDYFNTLSNGVKKRVVIYAHGGLNAEQDGIKRVRVMAPYFKANGIYPVFVVWKTGLSETLKSMLQDWWQAKSGTKDAPVSSGLDLLGEALDRLLEVSLRPVGKGVWGEMKENAMLASSRSTPGFSARGRNSRQGGMAILANALNDLAAEHRFQIHIAGHSAGAILVAHWLRELEKRALRVKTLNLFAPACTLELANEAYIRAVEKQVIDKQRFHVYMMDDERELADNVFSVYRKSLLYLVSRGFEDVHKMPLMGMSKAWDTQVLAETDGKFNSAQHSAIRRWIQFASEGDVHIAKTLYGRQQRRREISLQGASTRLAHGSFDNDIEVIETAIRMMLQTAKTENLDFPVENLQGF